MIHNFSLALFTLSRCETLTDLLIKEHFKHLFFLKRHKKKLEIKCFVLYLKTYVFVKKSSVFAKNVDFLVSLLLNVGYQFFKMLED